MNANRVYQRIRRTNRSKKQRNPPIASIGNHCNPSLSFKFDERIFRNTILPLAVANKWVDLNKDIYMIDTPQNVQPNTDTVVFTYSDIFAVRFNVITKYDPNNLPDYKVTVLYSDGTTHSEEIDTYDPREGIFQITITPINATIYDMAPIYDNPLQKFVSFNMISSSIVGINLQDCTFDPTNPIRIYRLTTTE